MVIKVYVFSILSRRRLSLKIAHLSNKEPAQFSKMKGIAQREFHTNTHGLSYFDV